MTKFLEDIIKQQTTFENGSVNNLLIKNFIDLYRIEHFRDGLDLILTKLLQKELSFEVRVVKDWDTNVGCFLTEPKSFYDKTMGKVFHKKSLKIILRNINHNVIAHEMAHALEFESKINLGEEFRQAIGYDMKNRSPQIITLKAEIKRLMVDALKAYPQNQFLSELFARYFELLSISRNVISKGEFSTLDVTNFFENTTNFLEKIFNPQIRSKIDPKITSQTSLLIKNINTVNQEKTFQDKIESNRNPSKTWSGKTKSNAAWQSSWNDYKKIDDKK